MLDSAAANVRPAGRATISMPGVGWSSEWKLSSAAGASTAAHTQASYSRWNSSVHMAPNTQAATVVTMASQKKVRVCTAARQRPWKRYQQPVVHSAHQGGRAYVCGAGRARVIWTRSTVGRRRNSAMVMRPEPSTSSTSNMTDARSPLAVGTDAVTRRTNMSRSMARLPSPPISSWYANTRERYCFTRLARTMPLWISR